MGDFIETLLSGLEKDEANQFFKVATTTHLLHDRKDNAMTIFKQRATKQSQKHFFFRGLWKLKLPDCVVGAW